MVWQHVFRIRTNFHVFLDGVTFCETERASCTNRVLLKGQISGTRPLEDLHN